MLRLGPILLIPQAHAEYGCDFQSQRLKTVTTRLTAQRTVNPQCRQSMNQRPGRHGKIPRIRRRGEADTLAISNSCRENLEGPLTAYLKVWIVRTHDIGSEHHPEMLRVGRGEMHVGDSDGL